MNIKNISANGNEIAYVNSDVICISDVQSALDLMMSVHYETGTRSIVINKEAVEKLGKAQIFCLQRIHLSWRMLERKFVNACTRFFCAPDCFCHLIQAIF